MLPVLLDIGEQGLREDRQIEEPVFGLPQHRPTPIEAAARIEQFCGVELHAAVVTLIATGIGCAAVRTGPLDIAIREETAFLLGVQLCLRLSIQVAAPVQPEKNVLGDTMVIFRRGVRKEIVTNTQRLLDG